MDSFVEPLLSFYDSTFIYLLLTYVVLLYVIIFTPNLTDRSAWIFLNPFRPFVKAFKFVDDWALEPASHTLLGGHALFYKLILGSPSTGRQRSSILDKDQEGWSGKKVLSPDDQQDEDEDSDEDEDDIPQSELEAQEHIARIRKSKGVDGPEGPSVDLTQALKIFANELYKKPTHFLLELIQNADDNSYDPQTTPSLSITLTKGILRIDSNELGFTRKNIESLCSIGRSSKKSSERGTRYIGQKGIGFKSVFKVAEAVYISSGPYSFKLDQTTPLGMLAPIWSQFPQNQLPGKTSILLKLSDPDSSELEKELQSIEAPLLLFLHQLREVSIQVLKSEWSWRRALWSSPSWAMKLRRGSPSRIGTLRQVTIHVGKKPTNFWVVAHEVEYLPDDPRREGCTTSEVMLGFPVEEKATLADDATAQQVYAFLPVGNFGFKFMIQADFLLVANREGLDSCDWNNTLINDIPDAFVKAVWEFNETTSHRYSWIKYLPGNEYHDDPFSYVSRSIIKELSDLEILEALDGHLESPSELSLIPEKFRDQDGTPLVPPGRATSKLLSDRYPMCFKDKLKSLGVDALPDAEFLSQLQSFIKKTPSAFQRKPQAWHCSLAKCLAALYIENSDNVKIINNLPIIRLRDGSWVAKTAGRIYLPDASKEGGSSLVSQYGVEVMEIDRSALDSPDIIKLLRLLGINKGTHEPSLSHPLGDVQAKAMRSLEELAVEAKKINKNTSLEKICDLLARISFQLRRVGSSAPRIPFFGGLAMFPIRLAGSTNKAFDRLYSSRETKEWFIATKQLRKCFEGKIDLLAIPDEKLDGLDELFNRLGLESRMLSRAIVAKEDRLVGKPILMPSLVEMLRARARYIGLLVPRDQPERLLLLEKLCSLRVYGVSKIKSEISVKFRGSIIDGVDDSTQVALYDLEQSESLKIYVVQGDDVGGHFLAYELGDQIASYCAIPQRYRNLVFPILLERHPAKLEFLLKAAEIQVDFSDFPAGDQEDMQGILDDDDDDGSWLKLSGRGASSKSKDLKKRDGFQSMVEGEFHFGLPTTSYPGYDTRARQFYAELYVSATLADIMGEDYDPVENWTSNLRTRAGHTPLRASSGHNAPSFTILDSNGTLSSTFSGKGRFSPPDSASPVLYHINVCTDRGLSKSSFGLPRDILQQFSKSRAISGKQDPDYVLVLAFVHGIYGKPGIRFFANPFQLYLENALSFESTTVWATVEDKSSAAFSHDFTDPQLVSGTQNLYAYKHLAPGHVRLLELLPGEIEDDLKGEIHHAAVGSSHPYRALSYVWGPPATSLIGCSLETESGIIGITPSLEVALRQFRDTSRSSWLWVDAVCINQKDNIEKTLQLPLIPDIYKGAYEVIGWLGTEEDDSDLAFEFLSSIHSGELLSPPAARWERKSMNRASFEITDNAWGAIDRILARPWFTRIWIVQELVWGSKVMLYCGDSALPWDDFFTSLRKLEKQRNAVRTGSGVYLLSHAHSTYALERARSRLKKKGRKAALLDLLDEFAYAQATYPCDKIFALLGLASDADEENPLFQADYDSPLDDVIAQFALGFVRQGRTLDLLHRAGTSKPHGPSSWIPDWTSGDPLPTISTWSSGSRGFHAGPPGLLNAVVNDGDDDEDDDDGNDQRNNNYHSSPRRNFLSISGWTIDTIRAVSLDSAATVGLDGTVPIRRISAAQAELGSLLAGAASYPTGETTAELLLRIPIGGAARPHRSARLTALLTGREDFLGEGGVGPTPLPGWDPDLAAVVARVRLDADSRRYAALPARSRLLYARYWETAAEFAGRFGRAGGGARFAGTDRGYAGLVPARCRPGDRVVVFPQCKVPFVLRETESERWTLIGEAYVHGLMFGEVQSLKGRNEKTFHIV